MQSYLSKVTILICQEYLQYTMPSFKFKLK